MKLIGDLKDFSALKIALASAKELLEWSYGEVTKPETINYRTFKPEKDGLFDERIFGPSKDFECYCGKYKRIRYKGVICDKCGVEVTHSRVRRERMGHIKLASPVAHVWFFRGIPSKMALVLDISPRNIESIVYFSSFIVMEIDRDKKAAAIDKVAKDLVKLRELIEKDYENQIAALGKDFGAKVKGGEGGFSAEEAEHKFKEKVSAIRTKEAEKIGQLESEHTLMQKKLESVELHTVLSDNEYLSLAEYVDVFCKVGIGAEALETILENLDLNALSLGLKETIENSKGQKAQKAAKRLRVVEGFRRAGIETSRMILNLLPVTPPDLRPMVQLEGGRFATSDLNDLYRRVINRNNRLRRLLDLGAPEIIVRNEKRMLQEAVDALLDSSKQRQTVRAAVKGNKKQLRSLADMLKGKQGRFRQNLLGKRVDYSGRSVIVNGPELKINECGIPKNMALELFKPFVLREILARGLAPNVKSAKYVLEQEAPEVWEILEGLVQDHPVLLNRAPTLWRLGIQAFYPKLVEGSAIRLHLCVCPGYNADFDGDQMAVHLPLSQKAIDEAKTLMISTNNLRRPADGSPMSIPTKIMLFGIYYITSVDTTLQPWPRVFASTAEVLYAHESNKIIGMCQTVKVRINGAIVETTPGRIIFNQYVPESFGFINDTLDKKKINALIAKSFETQALEVTAKLIDDIKDLGFKYGTSLGHSTALSDVVIPEAREALIATANEEVVEINKNYRRGLITELEAKRLREDVWNKVTTQVDEKVWESLKDENPLKMEIVSGSSRASRDQIKQIGGIRGLITDTTGRILELPILGNYKLGLSGMEYFLSGRGARKGLVDKALKTADAGYMTRRLVDVAQDVVVRQEDCRTEKGREVAVGEKTVLTSFADRIAGRYLAQDIKMAGRIVAEKGTLLTKDVVKTIEQSGVDKIVTRSPMTCETKRGVCQKCYGVDVMSDNIVQIGIAVGVQAAQAIGEPGTQLTMKTFQTGGVATVKDITQGLPRVEEVFEARAPKNLSIMAEITGTVSVSKSGDERKITILPADKDELAVEYAVDPVSEIVIKEGQLVVKGEKLTSGHLDLTDLMRATGVAATRKYIIDEIQKVYSSQGVVINDKHIEVIVRQMFNHVRIDDPGDTAFLEGETATKATFEEENARIVAEGGSPATAKITLLGITKASLNTDSFLSAASFIQTSNVLTDAASSGKVDRLIGLKENVIIGRLIPTGERARLED
ncbi:TPA: DNA-directed RNA polymerase subunit beta' [candidate division WWE3 bacterium]|uniref:DNA-directed RNA polymerase subunit beta' n=2 Tax=Katanobacteria TaxID=422282 RepID=A0A0G1JP18_UNCKA|nr:MAG: DNA-directed RNA polymerase subunit beta' [candidate division WWE3 bacterium GW2011_GWA2_44_16]HAZ29324.1 DNA-directed RNA polymerase subunit beta' [candidate division WWE3 bacterium]